MTDRAHALIALLPLSGREELAAILAEMAVGLGPVEKRDRVSEMRVAVGTIQRISGISPAPPATDPEASPRQMKLFEKAKASRST